MKKLMVMTAALSVISTSSAIAEGSPRPRERSAERVLYVCDASMQTRRAFEREHGAMVFVSAQEAMQAKSSKQAWSAPRCITQAENKRLQSLIKTDVQVAQLNVRR